MQRFAAQKRSSLTAKTHSAAAKEGCTNNISASSRPVRELICVFLPPF